MNDYGSFFDGVGFYTVDALTLSHWLEFLVLFSWRKRGRTGDTRKASSIMIAQPS